jgi:hypothetical protein
MPGHVVKLNVVGLLDYLAVIWFKPLAMAAHQRDLASKALS